MARTESVGQMCFDPLSAEATAQPTMGSYNELLLNSVGWCEAICELKSAKYMKKSSGSKVSKRAAGIFDS